MMTLPTRRQLDRARQNISWDFGNKILYDLCRENFQHNKDECILAKVLFIGRIYAAAIERRKNKKDDINDNFYIDVVAPTFRKSKLDQHLDRLKQIKELSIDTISQVLETHHYLTTIIYNITRLEKRSFCSKYLHFHLPNLFFIYDSRAVIAIRQFTSKIPSDLRQIPRIDKTDKEYAKFFCKCFDLKRQIENRDKTRISNRQLDNMLIEIANKKNSLSQI